MLRILSLLLVQLAIGVASLSYGMVGPILNLPPETSGIADHTAVDATAITLSIAGAFTDPEGEPLEFSASGLPGGLALNATTGVITGTLANDASQSAPFSITITATDAMFDTVATTFALVVTNPAPVTTGLAAQNATDGTAVSIDTGPSFSDPDGDALSFSAAGLPGGLAIDPATGAITGSLPNDTSATSPFAVIVTATDAQGASVDASFTLTVTNPEPVTTGIAAQTDIDGATVSIAAGPSFSDPDGDALSFSAAGLPGGLAIDPATGAITGSLPNDTSATSPFAVIVTATDAQGASVDASFTLTVTNPAPVASPDDFTTAYQTQIEGSVATNDADPDGDVLTFSRTSIPAHGAATVLPDGTFTYIPAAGFSGHDSFTYAVSDAQGAAASATVSITVQPDPNTVPSTAGFADQQGIDSSEVSINIAPAFADADGDVLTYSGSGFPAGVSLHAATGLISGTLAADASALSPYAITVTATDPHGASIATGFELVVTNPVPVAIADSFTCAFETMLEASVAGNDADPDGDTVTWTVTSEPGHGSITLTTAGAFSYTPAIGFHGTDTFTYRLTDAQGAHSDATVSITVNPKPNAAPVAVDDIFSCAAAQISGDVSGNDSDPDGDALTFALVSAPASGSLNLSESGQFQFSPEPGMHGAVHFIYAATDPSGARAEATATITVLAAPVNDVHDVAPILDAELSQLVTDADQPALQVSDADSATLTVVLSSIHGELHIVDTAGVAMTLGETDHGTRLTLEGSVVALNAALSTLVYQAPDETCGLDEITITTTDGDGLADTDVLELTLGAVLIAGDANERVLVGGSLEPSLVQEARALGVDTSLFDSVATVVGTDVLHLVATPVLFASDDPRTAVVHVTLRRFDGTTRDVAVPTLIYSPRVETLSAPKLNPQTSLYEQSVRVVNSTPATLAGFQLVFGSLPSGVTLYSATGTSGSGSPVIASAAPLAPGASAHHLVEYASANLQTFAQPVITLQLIAGATSNVPSGTVRAITRIIRQEGRNYLEFATVAGELYWVQYRDAADTGWSTSPTPVSGTGSSIHWLDAGAPMSSGTPPAGREYRLLVATAQFLPLQITRQPESIRAAPGAPVALSVGAIGARALTYQWYHDGARLAEATGSALDLPAAGPSCEGEYRVSVCDGRSTVWSTVARVALAGVKPARLANLSVRARVGATPLITGFVFAGKTSHTIAARAVGPTLARFGVAKPVLNPRARLFLASAAIAENDDWAADASALLADEALERVGAFPLAPDSTDAVLLRTLQPGAYTLHTLNPGEPGIALAELFETGSADGLINISGRARVAAGEDALIAGFVIDGEASARVMIRAVGPTLARFGVSDVLADPRLTIHRTGSAAAIAANDDWSDHAETITGERLFARVGAFSLPDGSRDAAIVLRLPPGGYTAVVHGSDGGSGEALVEVYLISF